MSTLIYDAKTENYESARVERTPFDEALRLLAAAGLSLIPAHLNALLRRKLGPKAFIFGKGNYVEQGIFRTPSGIYFTNNSPVLAHPGEATAAHRQRQPFMASQEDIARALEDAVKVTRTAIPVNELADDPVGQFLFHDEAGPYGEFLLSQTNIHVIPIHVSLAEGEADQLWFDRLDGKFGLYGGNRYLDYGDRVRGVREVGTTGAAPNSEHYSPSQIAVAFETQKLPGLEKILEELRKKPK